MKGNILLCVTLILLMLSTLLTSMALLITMRLDLVMLKKNTNEMYDLAQSVVEEYAKNIQLKFNQALYQYISLELAPQVIQESINFNQNEQELQAHCYQMIKKQCYDPFVQDYLHKGAIELSLNDIEITLTITNLNRKNIKLEDQFYIVGVCTKDIDSQTQSKYVIEALMHLNIPKTIPSQINKKFILLNHEDKPEFLKYALWIDNFIVLNDADSLNVIGGLCADAIVTLEQLESGLEVLEKETLNQEVLKNLKLETHPWCYETPIEINKTEIDLSNYYVTEDIEGPHPTLVINTNPDQILKIHADNEHQCFKGWILSKGPVEIEDDVIIEGGIVASALTIGHHLTIAYQIDTLLNLMPYDSVLYETILEQLEVMNYLSNSIESYLTININDIALDIESIKLKS